MPVPTSGASVRRSGTAWRCMFEPMSARFASSFSRNGISAAATDDELVRRHVHELDRSGRTIVNSPPMRDGDEVGRELTFLASSGAFACAIVRSSSSSAEQIDDLVGHARRP